MKYGFVLDQTRCIGCHACTVACKSEHNIPVGVFRTWVKYIEKGEFPASKRHFGVLRCNHCDDAPCIAICPTKALFKRSDGIVDFDSDRCIGCKSCMQACPYDAIYIDPLNLTAAKCNYCAHRVEENLAPACVIVCPTQAIVAGDLDDPDSSISKMVNSDELKVRKPQKNTKPQVFYKGADDFILDPDLNIQNRSSMMTQVDGIGSAEQLAPARTTYQVEHFQPWGAEIAAYLWTKSVAAGALLIPAIFGTDSLIASKIAPVASFIFLAVTGFLLVWDLKRPERFLYIFLRPNFRSWLVLGSYIILLFGVVNLMWLYFGFTGQKQLLGYLRIPAILLSIMTACYSAFLFSQAKGRDLWLSKLLFFHLLIAAMTAGFAVHVLLSIIKGESYSLWFNLLVGFSVIQVLFTVIDSNLHYTAQIKKILPQLLNLNYYVIVFCGGLLIPLVAWLAYTFAASISLFALIIVITSLAALFEYARLWIKAGQVEPLS